MARKPVILVHVEPRLSGLLVTDTRPIAAELRGQVIPWSSIDKCAQGSVVLDAEGRPRALNGRPLRWLAKGHFSTTRRAWRRWLISEWRAGRLGLTSRMPQDWTEVGIWMSMWVCSLAGLANIPLVVHRWPNWPDGASSVEPIMFLAMGCLPICLPMAILQTPVCLRLMKSSRILCVRMTSDGVEMHRADGSTSGFAWTELKRASQTASVLTIRTHACRRLELPASHRVAMVAGEVIEPRTKQSIARAEARVKKLLRRLYLMFIAGMLIIGIAACLLGEEPRPSWPTVLVLPALTAVAIPLLGRVLISMNRRDTQKCAHIRRAARVANSASGSS